jgi:hypothetical protein
MKDLTWIEAPHHHESLAVCLRALMATRKLDRPYEEIVSLLGLGAVVMAARGETLGWWSAFGRDTRLSEVARAYGIRLRALHPPAAAIGLGGQPREYALHFQDSYLPLIERALAHDQMLLTWRGWPPQREYMWGLITDKQGTMYIGYSLWHGGQVLPLTGPAHQVYVVEEFERPTLEATADQLFTGVAEDALRAWDGQWTAQPDLLTGAPVYDAWQDELRNPSPATQHPLHQQHALATRALVSARRSLATWLRSLGQRLTATNTSTAAAWVNACDHVVECLGRYESNEATRKTIDSTDGVEKLCAAIDAAQRIESEAMARLRANLSSGG